MPKYALIDGGGLVVNVIVADSAEDARLIGNCDCVQIDLAPGGPGVNWKYENGTWKSPEIWKNEPEQIPSHLE